MGQQEDNGKIGEREHDAEDQADGHDRQDHRQNNLVVATPEARAVDRGGIDNVLRNRGDAGEEDHDGKWKEAPGVDDDHTQHREVRIAEPVRRVLASEKAGCNQCPVDHAVERIEHPLPGDRGERDRHRERQNDQRPNELAAGEGPQQQEGAELSEHEAEQLRSEREDEGVTQRLEKSSGFR